MNKNIFFTILYLLVVSNCHSQIVYVKQDATGLNNGTSWQNAYTNLSTAINATSNGQIWLSQGIYIPSTDLNGLEPTNVKLNTFKLKLNIAIYGGFSGVETDLNQRNWNLYPTILSGEIGSPNDTTDNLYHVVSCEYSNLNLNTILDGLTIKRGYAIVPGGNAYGGGIYVNQTNNGSFMIKNCMIEENSAVGNGGGLYVFNSNPIIENCIFRNNKAFRGGGMYLWYSNATVNNCQIYDNIADNFPTVGSSALAAGGIYIGSYSSPKISHNTITNNFAVYEGGALSNESNYEVIFNNNIVSGNQSRDGGALFLGWTTYCFNNLIFNNQATFYGGAIFMDYDGNRSQLINNTIIQNSAGSQGGGLYIYGANPDVINSIFYNNTSPIGPQIRANNNAGNWAPDFRYCNIQGGLANLASIGNAIVYQDNIDVNPLFADVSTNNYRLQATSALINAGNTTLFPATWSGSNGQTINFPSTDLDGYQRIVGTIDIGAYENGSSLGIHSVDDFSFTLYPNPSNGIFTITTNTVYDSLSVHNSQGVKLFQSFFEAGMTSVNLSNYPTGLYIVHFSIDNKIYMCKIIKK